MDRAGEEGIRSNPSLKESQLCLDGEDLMCDENLPLSTLAGEGRLSDATISDCFSIITLNGLVGDIEEALGFTTSCLALLTDLASLTGFRIDLIDFFLEETKKRIKQKQ